MVEKLAKGVLPAIHELRQALAAIDRAKSKDYPPHVYVRMVAALQHSQKIAP